MINEIPKQSETNLQEQPKLSAGQMIKQARTQAGLHIAALAVTLKVPVKRLEALEDDNLTLLPDMVFTRALTASVCNTLKVDPAPILALMPKTGSPRLASASKSIDAPIRSALSNDKMNLMDFMKTPWMIGGAVLLLGAAAIYWWPAMRSDNAMSLQESKTVVAPASQTNDANVIHVSPVVAIPVSSPNFTATSINAAVSDNIVTFKASGESWVEAKDAKGNTVLKQLMKAGESTGAKGDLPLTVTIGHAEHMQVFVRGEAKDLVTIAKNNVAHFEVK